MANSMRTNNVTLVKQLLENANIYPGFDNFWEARGSDITPMGIVVRENQRLIPILIFLVENNRANSLCKEHEDNFLFLNKKFLE